jgi:hypothetical protein
MFGSAYTLMVAKVRCQSLTLLDTSTTIAFLLIFNRRILLVGKLTVITLTVSKNITGLRAAGEISRLAATVIF